MNESEDQVQNELTALTLPESMSTLLAEASEKTGKSPEEILSLCLEYGMDQILREAEGKMTHPSQNIA